jgi:hypothetical protein
MSTTEETSEPEAVTAEDHIREARRYAAIAEMQEGGRGYEDMLLRSADLQAAQVHATLAQTLKAAELMSLMAALVQDITSPRSAPREEPGNGH